MRIPGVIVLIDCTCEEDNWQGAILEYDIEDDIVRRVDDTIARKIRIDNSTSHTHEKPNDTLWTKSCEECEWI
jgi:hypothetical protein